MLIPFPRGYLCLLLEVKEKNSCILILLLSLSGIPPTAGFMGKYFLFAAAVEKGMVLLASAARMITG